jgi:hypothetical protein
MATPETPAPPSVTPTGCCAPFDPTPWQDQQVVWKDKPFLADHVRCFLHIPLNFGTRVTKDLALIEAAHAKAEQLMLSQETSPFGADIFIQVDKDIPGATMKHLSGTFVTRVYEGPFRDAGRWFEDMNAYLRSKGHTPQSLYLGYTTCPKCAKAYGKNYVILLAKVADAA